MDRNLDLYVEEVMASQQYRNGIFRKRWWWPFW